MEGLVDTPKTSSAVGEGADDKEGERGADEGSESGAENAGRGRFTNFEVHLNRPQVSVVHVCVCVSVFLKSIFYCRAVVSDGSPTSIWSKASSILLLCGTHSTVTHVSAVP